MRKNCIESEIARQVQDGGELVFADIYKLLIASGCIADNRESRKLVAAVIRRMAAASFCPLSRRKEEGM